MRNASRAASGPSNLGGLGRLAAGAIYRPARWRACSGQSRVWRPRHSAWRRLFVGSAIGLGLLLLAMQARHAARAFPLDGRSGVFVTSRRWAISAASSWSLNCGRPRRAFDLDQGFHAKRPVSRCPTDGKYPLSFLFRGKEKSFRPARLRSPDGANESRECVPDDRRREIREQATTQSPTAAASIAGPPPATRRGHAATDGDAAAPRSDSLPAGPGRRAGMRR